MTILRQPFVLLSYLIYLALFATKGPWPYLPISI